MTEFMNNAFDLNYWQNTTKFWTENFETITRQMEKLGKDVVEHGRWNFEEHQRIWKKNLETYQTWMTDWQAHAMHNWQKFVEVTANNGN